MAGSVQANRIQTFVAVTLAAASSVANALEIEFEYYADGINDCCASCPSSIVSAFFITTEPACHNLTNNAAESFHIGGPRTEEQVGILVTPPMLR